MSMASLLSSSPSSSTITSLPPSIYLKLLSAAAASFLVFLLFNRRSSASKPLNLPPGPKGWPVVGNLFQVALSGKQFIHYVRDLRDVYGPIFTLRMGARTMVIISSPELAHEALISKGQQFASRPPENPTRTVFSCDKFTVNSALYGSEWRSLRRNMVSGMLSSARLREFRPARESAMDRFIDRIRAEAESSDGVHSHHPSPSRSPISISGPDPVRRPMAREEVGGRGGETPMVADEHVISAVDSSHRDTASASQYVTRLQPRPVLAPIQVAAAPSTPPPLADPFPPHPSALVAPAGTLNSRKYTNRISLLIFLLHLLAAVAAVGFFIFKAAQVLVVYAGSATSKAERREVRALRYWLPPIEASAALGIALAFAWQKAVRAWPNPPMINFVLWSTFASTMSAGVLLLCLALPAASGLGVALVVFSVGTALYSCWVTTRIPFTAKVFARALQPVDKFKGLNGPAYAMMGAGFVWVSVWCTAVIGAQSYYYPPLTIMGLVVSLAWTVETMRNVVNLTVSRVISLYYLRGMQPSIRFCFQRALSVNLGSAALGSVFVPTIEALRIMARGLNLLEEEDEFMFSCAHCCLRFMEFVFHYGNSWAFVHVAAYGKGFVAASKSTWGMFERQGMEEMVDSDMTSSVCFLTGVCSGALCVIMAASWTYATHRAYTATVSLLAFFVGYLMTRIAMALPHACVACYYVCYAENPGVRLFDSTIPEMLGHLRADRDVLAPTPRFPRR